MLDKNEQLLQTIGQAIAKYRQASGLTQAQLAEMLGISNDAVSRMSQWCVAYFCLRAFMCVYVFVCLCVRWLAPPSPRPRAWKIVVERACSTPPHRPLVTRAPSAMNERKL